MLFIAGGERPKPVEPSLDRLRMAGALVAHAEDHFNAFSARVDRILAGKSPDTGHIAITVVRVAPLSREQELALDIEVKHCVEDLHSALEYAAMEIYEQYCCTEPSTDEPHVHRQVTFPVPEVNSTEEAFATKVEAVFPHLQSHSKVAFDLVMGFRRFASGNEVWVDTLHSVWSEVKHRRLGRDAKPVRVVIAGMDRDQAPSAVLYYFPGTTRAVSPNLAAAIREIGSFVASLADIASHSRGQSRNGKTET